MKMSKEETFEFKNNMIALAKDAVKLDENKLENDEINWNYVDADVFMNLRTVWSKLSDDTFSTLYYILFDEVATSVDDSIEEQRMNEFLNRLTDGAVGLDHIGC